MKLIVLFALILVSDVILAVGKAVVILLVTITVLVAISVPPVKALILSPATPLLYFTLTDDELYMGLACSILTPVDEINVATDVIDPAVPEIVTDNLSLASPASVTFSLAVAFILFGLASSTTADNIVGFAIN